MTINTQDMIGSILESISRIDYIKPEDIPNIQFIHGSGHYFYGGTACLLQALSGR